jgi:hypothetical protein
MTKSAFGGTIVKYGRLGGTGEAKRRRAAPKQRRKSGDASLEDRAGERVKPRKGNIMIGSDYRRNGREICWPFQTRVVFGTPMLVFFLAVSPSPARADTCPGSGPTGSCLR